MIAFATSGGTDPPFLATWPMDYNALGKIYRDNL